jgi:HD superfamily phosphohydrolase
MEQNRRLLQPSATTSFADVAHGTLIFNQEEASQQLVLRLIDTRWMQRLRSISQTGNTKLVYMFAEHSRFGHCLGVAYLANSLMEHLRRSAPELVDAYRNAVAAAAILHDVGHVAPGSHLAERIWAPDTGSRHEHVSIRVIHEDPEISTILTAVNPALPELVCKILAEDESLPPWTHQIISGGGWNADRGNWAIVDSAMCAVSYGRYNVSALIDAFRLSASGELVLHESRLDALTHFFVARDSMYRQIYQHRVLQAVDALTQKLVLRLRDIVDEDRRLAPDRRASTAAERLQKSGIFADPTMLEAIVSENYAKDLSLESIFRMTESWWRYHVERWCEADDRVLADLSRRYRDRELLKTIRLQELPESERFIDEIQQKARNAGFDPRYYVALVQDADAHRGKTEQAPMVLLDSGQIVPVTSVEPMIAQILDRPRTKRRWLAVPKEIKESMGRIR